MEKESLPTNYLYLPSLHLYIQRSVSEGDVSPVQCYRKAPSLLELRTIAQTYLDQKDALTSERGEWTSDFIHLPSLDETQGSIDGYLPALYVSKPFLLFRDHDSWQFYGGKVFPVTLPPSGWVIPNTDGSLYDPHSGLPFHTTINMEEAESSHYAYFWRANPGDGLVAINRECERLQGDAFEISAVQSPDFSHENIGVREVFSSQMSYHPNDRRSTHHI